MISHSIRGKLILRLSLVLILFAVATNAALYFYLKEELQEQYDESLLTEARAIAAVWHPQENAEQQSALIAKTFPQLRFGSDDGDSLYVFDGSGRLVMAVPESAARKPLVGSSSGRRSQKAFDVLLPDGRAGRAIEVVVNPSEPPKRKSNARYQLTLAEPRDEFDDTCAHLLMSLLLIGGGLSAAAIWLVGATVRKELRKVTRFSDSVGRLDVDSLAYRFTPEQLVRELRPIAERLNEMLARLQSAFARERRFADNVAHELRTPLTELRSTAEVAAKWPLESHELQNHHQRVVEISERMSSVVERLLTLVRADASRLAAKHESVELVEALRVAWFSHERIAGERNITISFKTPIYVVIVTDANILYSLLDNIMHNAATYAVEGTAIDCEVVVDDSKSSVTMRLTNVTHELAEDDLKHVEEPFWQKDMARSSGRRFGLGLSLVRQYAIALNLICRYRKTAPDQFCVEIVWENASRVASMLPRASVGDPDSMHPVSISQSC